LLADYYTEVPDGVVNDRFMPHSAAWSVARWGPARSVLDRAAARTARRGSGIVPPAPPLYDVRTPEYTVFDDIQRYPWECVRGIDKSFGYNAMSTDDDRLSERDLLWMLVDIVAKNGNLLLNVGPRGADAQIPEEQLARLDWLGSFVETNEPALRSTRPWVTPTSGTNSNVEVRYTARDGEIYALVRASDPAAVVTQFRLPELRPDPMFGVLALDARGAQYRPAPGGNGIDIEPATPITGDRPVVFEIHGAIAAPTVDSGASRSS
jgi:alpha-L-fucosidase